MVRIHVELTKGADTLTHWHFGWRHAEAQPSETQWFAIDQKNASVDLGGGMFKIDCLATGAGEVEYAFKVTKAAGTSGSYEGKTLATPPYVDYSYIVVRGDP